MKNLFFLLLTLPMFAFTSNDLDQNMEAITQAIRSGNADALGSYFDESVEVAILEDEDIYNKSEAIGKVKTFFSKYKPNNFSQVHQGKSKGSDSEYCIGNMVSGGTTFRVYVFVGNSGGKKLIQELRFDKG